MNISDHEAIFVTRKKKKERFVTRFIDARSYINYNKVEFQQQLMDLDWTDFYELDTVDKLWDYFLLSITKVTDVL